ncbi:MAG: hypothetical protein A3J38_10720 [Gammaproteobacteria bacterium RIFCSPHIGHO2_12_FULL_45_9]|nr:MAG: hypothetical protein A3J38_10720 [Gammaproteobacteria bacterium RIFCSPHIGHO2_12_FULL_45_9]
MNQITLTESTIAYIQKLLLRKETPHVFRLTVKRAGCNGYLYQPVLAEKPEADDVPLTAVTAFEAYVAGRDVALLAGVTVDCVESSLGQRKLVFQNPKAIAECGCGESFSVKQTDADEDGRAGGQHEGGCR